MVNDSNEPEVRETEKEKEEQHAQIPKAKTKTKPNVKRAKLCHILSIYNLYKKTLWHFSASVLFVATIGQRRMLRFGCILLLACALAQTQAVKIYARSAELPATEDIEDEVEDPEPEGRVISFFREQEPPRYQFDAKPIVITAPGPTYSQPIYTQPAPAPPPPPVVYPAPQPYPQPFPQPFPQPIPVPVPVQFPVPSPPTTIIKPIISRPHHHDHHDHHHHDKRPSYRPPFFPFLPSPLPSFPGSVFNFTYAPVLAAASTTTRTGNNRDGNDLIRGTEQLQLSDINQIAQLFSQFQQQQQPQPFNPAAYTPQAQLGQLQQYAQIQQLLQQQPLSQFANQAPQSQSVAVPTSLLLQALASSQQQLPSNLPANFDLEALQQQLAEGAGGRRKYRPEDGDDYVVRRSKPKKKSKKSKKNKGQAKQVIFLALDSAEAADQAQAQAGLLQ